MVALGPRPKHVSLVALTRLRRRVILTSVGLLLVFTTALSVVNMFVPEDASVVERVVVNVVAIAGYSAAMAYLWYRAGIRQYDLTKASTAVLDDIPAGIAFLNELFRFEFVNREFARICGVSRRDLLDRDVSSVIWPDDREKVDRAHKRRLVGEGSTYELRIHRPDGSAAETVVSAIPFMNEGKFEGVLAVVDDITEFVEVRREAERFRNVSGFLMDAVTHDLSNSMQIVLSLSGVASKLTAGKDDRLAKLAVSTEEAAERSTRLIKDVKMIAVAENQEWPAGPTRIGRVVAEALDRIGPSTRAYIRADIPPDLANAMVSTNDLAVLSVAKVLEEAISGISPEEPHVELLVSSRSSHDEGAIIAITIRGSKQTPGRHDVQALTQTPSDFTAARLVWRQGVRLALASAIAEAQGWRLVAVPEESGIGTIFEFRIPRTDRREPDGGFTPAGAALEAGAVRGEPFA